MGMGKVKSIASNRAFLLAFASTLAVLCALLVPTQFAWASIADDINAWLCGVLRDWCNWIFGAQTDVMKSLGANGVLSAPFETMLTSAGDVSMYDIAHGVWQVAIVPIGCGVLGLVFTLKLIEISQRMDGNQSLPGVKEVVFLLVFFAVFLFLIQHSFDLMAAIYEVVGLAIDRVEGLFGTGGALDMATVSVVTTDDDLSYQVLEKAGLRGELLAGGSAFLAGGGVCLYHTGNLGTRDPALHHGRLLPDTACVPRLRPDAPDRHRLPEELRCRVPGGSHHSDPAHQLSCGARRNRRREPGHGNAH